MIQEDYLKSVSSFHGPQNTFLTVYKIKEYSHSLIWYYGLGMLVTYGGVSCVLAPQAAFQNEEETARLLGSIFLHTGGLYLDLVH